MKFLLTILMGISVVVSQEDDEHELVNVGLELADFDLSDAYDEVSEVTKSALLEHNYEEKVFVEKDRAKLMREQSAKNREFEDILPFDLERKWSLLTRSGDVLMPEADYSALVTFHNENEKLSNYANLTCTAQDNSTTECVFTKQDYVITLASSRNLSHLNETWSRRQNIFVDYQNDFNSTLQLANKAFIPNEEHNVRSYWEMLSEYPEGYTKAQALWEEIQPLYKKLHEFIRKRLYKHYNIGNSSDSKIPVYLLGSDFGTDWSNIADIILPHPYLYEEVKAELKQKTVQEIYELAEGAMNTMGLKHLGKKFWAKSNFNSSVCGPYVFSNCRQHYSEILTCNKLGWPEYLDIYEAAMTVAVRNQDYASLPRQELRFSAFDEALRSLGSIIAINSLPQNDLVPPGAFKEETDSYQRRITALLLTALRVLPKIPFYLLSDLWRLEELEFSYGNFTETWWSKRNGMQGVCGNTNREPDFLGNPYITSNKPMLSKFLGTFLQFQIVDYYQRYFYIENGTTIHFIQNDDNFIQLIKDKSDKSWLDLMLFHLGIEEVSSIALLEYFRPLEKYLDNAPLDQVIIPIVPRVRVAKTTPKPTPKRVKGLKKLIEQSLVNDTVTPVSVSQNRNQMQMKKVDAEEPVVNSEVPGTKTASSQKLYVLLGIAAAGVVGFAAYLVVKRLKRKPRTNNRRFEA